MSIDIKEIVENVVEKITSNEALQKKFQEEPIKVIEKLIKVDLPEQQIEKVIDLVKAKMKLVDISDVAENLKNIDDISDIADIAENLGGFKGLGKLFRK